MSADAIKRLETVRKVIQAGRDTKHAYPSQFTEGMQVGLDLALEHIEREIRWAKDLDAALAEAGSAA
jgi:hypothetical protein